MIQLGVLWINYASVGAEVVWKGVYKDAHTWTAFQCQCHSGFEPRNLKGGIGSLFAPCVNAMGRRPYCSSRMVVSYCTFGFGAVISAICAHYRYPVIHHAVTNMRVHARKATHALNEIIWWGLATKKSGGTITHLHTCTARWPPQQIPPLNFLGLNSQPSKHKSWHDSCALSKRLLFFPKPIHCQWRILESVPWDD